MKTMKTIMKTLDGFKNILKGLGTSKDGRNYNQYAQGKIINQQEANILYIYNWLLAKIVDIPVDDATRKWRSLIISDPEEKKTAEDALESFDVKGNINQVLKWARVFGGAAVIAIIEGEDPESPMVIDRIRPGTLKNFIVLDRYNLFPESSNRDILSKNFGKPEFYNVSRGGQRIHHTRVYKFLGATSTIRELEQQNFWGNSIFTRLLEPVTDSQTTSQSISNLVLESNVDVYMINGLNSLVAEGRDDLVTKRLKIAHEMKSIINGIAIDKEDGYEKKSNNFATLDKIDEEFKQSVCGAADIPYTRLWGKSPAGMNATGESDMLNYFDNIQSIQENDLRPGINWMDSIILSSADIEGPLQYEFKPLKQLTEVEQADVDSKNAIRDRTYIDAAVIEPSDVMAQLAEDGTYVSIDENRVEAERDKEDLGFDE